MSRLEPKKKMAKLISDSDSPWWGNFNNPKITKIWPLVVEKLITKKICATLGLFISDRSDFWSQHVINIRIEYIWLWFLIGPILHIFLLCKNNTLKKITSFKMSNKQSYWKFIASTSLVLLLKTRKKKW